MSKAINWPIQFRQEVIDEPADSIKCAFRLGRIYFDNHYWVDGDPVDIRVNHRVIRQATIVGDLQLLRITDLTPEIYAMQKKSLQSQQAVIDFLYSHYGQNMEPPTPITPDTEVVVVRYCNSELDPEIMDVEDDPHMAADASPAP